MKFLIALLAFIALAHCELVRTPQFKRRRTDGFIVGGQPSDISRFPHMLALWDMSPNWGGFICGASNIAQHFALSAAHCLDMETPPHFIQLRGGNTNRQLGTVFVALNYWNHPRYDPRWLDFDIAVIQTVQPLVGYNIVPVALPRDCHQHCCGACEHDLVDISGWGRTEAGGGTLMLHEITLPVYNHQRCDEIWRGIGDHWVCVFAGNGKDSCSGDSGSPLVREIDGVVIQIGVVSFGSADCGDGSGPSVNVRVEYPEVRGWIRSLSGV